MKRRMGRRRISGLTVRLLIGAFIPKSQRGGGTNQTEREITDSKRRTSRRVADPVPSKNSRGEK